MIHALIVVDLVCLLLAGHLDTRRFNVRERADRLLAAAGPLAWSALDRVAPHLSSEGRVRAWRLTAGLREARALYAAWRMLPDGYPRLPWITEHPTEEAREWNMLAEKTERAWPPSCACTHFAINRKATLLWVESKLLAGVSQVEVVGVLDRMRDSEVNWIATHGRNYNPPVLVPKE